MHRFYIQDLVRRDNRTVWKISKTDLTDILPSAFGLVSVIDNLVTSRTGMDSREVGRIQGLIGLSDFREQEIFMLLNLVFTDGEYKGSRFCILGILCMISCGSCRLLGYRSFRMSRGYAITSTHHSDDIQQRGII
ncbi:dirigent protein 11-like [Primulina tabacum]|uniref:dirigent protein 11-like n=1 Tax=Primulina tabacum TaxID=48773 RepID=UPI003F59587A